METQSENKEQNIGIEKINFGKDFLNALLSFLVVAIGYLFIMPWNIWVAATKRLAALREEGGIIHNLTKTEFIVLNWMRLFFDAIIFILYVLGPLYLLYSAISSDYFTFKMFLSALAGIYFIPILIALQKELLSLLLVAVMKLEEIAKNTKK